MPIERLVKQPLNPELVGRFLTLYNKQLQHRLMNSVELTKIKLSSQKRCTTPLSYIEPELDILATIKDLAESSKGCLAKMDAVVSEVLASSGAIPDVVFITGGMGYSPIVRAHFKEKFGEETSIYYGDMMGSVGKGLGLQAAKQFGQ
jgi:hypothetical chaperone protein